MITCSEMVVPVSFCWENDQGTGSTLLDSGAAGNFLDTNFSTKHRIPLEALPIPAYGIESQWFPISLWPNNPSNHTHTDAGRNYAYGKFKLSYFILGA